MNDEASVCYICLEKFTQQAKLPKKMNCCKNVICLQCLQNIYIQKQVTQCPICRFNKKIEPNSLPTDLTVFDEYINCPNCKQIATKSELYFSFTLNNIKCSKCQTEDMTLCEYAQMIMGDLVDFLELYSSVHENVLIELLNSRLQMQLDVLFNEIKQNLFTNIKERLILEMKRKFNYDIIKNPSLLKTDINTLSSYLKNMQSFLNDNQIKQSSMTNLVQSIDKYIKDKEEITQKSAAFEHAKKIINESNMFNLKENIQVVELEGFFGNILETCLSDHEKLTHMTGIKFYDNYYSQILDMNKDFLLDNENSQIVHSKTNPLIEHQSLISSSPISQTTSETPVTANNFAILSSNENGSNNNLNLPQNNNEKALNDKPKTIWDILDPLKDLLNS